MRLSFDRALTVAKALAENGVNWWQMRLLACGDHERLAAFPAGPGEDAVNSRVEVVVTDEVAPEAVPTEPGDARNSDRWP
jgi:flagellar motor protein MotB